jgi:hypothetical protein
VVFRRRFANDEVISDWQARSDGGLLTNRDGQMKRGLKDDSERGSSEYSATSARMGSKSRNTSRSLTMDESENHGAIKENTRMESVTPHPMTHNIVRFWLPRTRLPKRSPILVLLSQKHA